MCDRGELRMPQQVGWMESWTASQRKWHLGLNLQEREWLTREQNHKQKAQCLVPVQRPLGRSSCWDGGAERRPRGCRK